MKQQHTEDEIIVVSSYPMRGSIHSPQTVGVAYYTKSMLRAVKQVNPGFPVTVFAEQMRGDKAAYTESGVTVRRTWKRGSLASIANLFMKLRRQKAEKIAVSFEINMFGKPQHTVLGLLGLWSLTVSGKHTYLIIHQVLADFRHIEGDTFKARLLNMQKNLLYWLMRRSASEIIVFEEQFKRQLGKHNHVSTVPLLIPKVATTTKAQAREQLGWKTNDRYILYFGFLAPYKGIDLLLANWPSVAHTHLIVAGGANPNHKKNKKYASYLKEVVDLAVRKGVTVTGFVPERKLPLYFAGCDAVILPYRTFMSSSAPLSIALGHGKPVLLATSLAPYALSRDIKKALTDASLSIRDMLFTYNEDSIRRAIKQVFARKQAHLRFAKHMRATRSEAQVARQMLEVLGYEK